MKKVMLLAAMLAMVLAAAVPALAQSVTQVGNGNVACVQTAVNQEIDKEQIAISQYGDATNYNIQYISQQCNVSVEQVNTVIDTIVVSGSASATASATASASAAPAVHVAPAVHAAPAVQYEYSAPAAVENEYSAPAAVQYQYSSASAAPVELPDTGGSSLIALGAGVLLVAGGLLARRIVR